jgi:nucleoside-diphosphate-sugar epimerase
MMTNANLTTPRALIVGFGDIGERVAIKLQSLYAVSVLIRKPERAATAQKCGADAIEGDLAALLTLEKIAALILDTVFHFAPPPNHGEADTHTANLLDVLSRAIYPPQHIIYISTTGVYGDCAGAVIDESSPYQPQTARAVRRVSAETQLQAWCFKHSVILTILRAPGIYALDRLPIARIRAGTPAIVAAEDSYTNHIHADDLASACICALGQSQTNIFNIVDDSDMKMGDYFELVADHFRLLHPPRLARAAAEALVSAPMLSFMRESRRIQNTKMKSDLKVVLRYPTVADFLNTVSRDVADLD